MSETRWDPTQYERFTDERGRPLRDLLARVGADAPGVVVDLGCGNGPATLTLADRWPRARVIGIDHSPQMLAAARSLDRERRVEWVQADLAAWDPRSLAVPADVVITNAALQWVPDHVTLVRRVIAALPAGGWFAMQVPDTWDAPSHVLIREVAAAHPRAAELAEAVDRLRVEPAEAYLQLLGSLGCAVDVWSTTYFHVLDPAGAVEDPVLEWVRGTTLRPALALLADAAERAAFLRDLGARLRVAYPRTPAGVVFPFRRTFAVAHR